ncbi:hypothetical protein C2G38_2058892, partial [Gigaspora rosea]
ICTKQFRLTTDDYIKLSKQCMDKDPMKRPTAKKVYDQLQEWKIILNGEHNELNEEQIKIKNKFLEADEIIPTLSTTLQKQQDTMHICQSINELDISETSKLTDAMDSEIINFKLP